MIAAGSHPQRQPRAALGGERGRKTIYVWLAVVAPAARLARQTGERTLAAAISVVPDPRRAVAGRRARCPRVPRRTSA